MNPIVRSITKCFYHGDKCADGKLSAWLFQRLKRSEIKNGKFVLQGFVHGQKPPEVSGDTVIILDYCFPRAVIKEMAKKAKHIYILDHHSSTIRDMAPIVYLKDGTTDAIPSNVTIVLDEKRSGAEITWDWVYPGIARPWFVEVVGDRDLFRWTKPYSKAVSSAFFHFNYYTWDRLEELFQQSEDEASINLLIKKFCDMAASIPDPTREIESICASAFLTNFVSPTGEKYRVKLVQSPRTHRSEVGNKLSQTGCDFAAMWQYDFMLKEWWISCRASDASPLNLSELCQQFKRGGGHKKSAGFTILGATGDDIHNYFTLVTVPPSRTEDLKLLREMGDYGHVIISNVAKK